MSAWPPQLRKRAKRWIFDEVGILMHSTHDRKTVLHAKHRTHSGSQDLKKKAWQEIADIVNASFKNCRDAKMCEDKVRCFCSEVKSKYCDLLDVYGRSGAGGMEKIRDSFNEIELLALDYIGVNSLDGVPDTEPTAMPSSSTVNGTVNVTPRPAGVLGVLGTPSSASASASGKKTPSYTRPKNIDKQTTEADDDDDAVDGDDGEGDESAKGKDSNVTPAKRFRARQPEPGVTPVKRGVGKGKDGNYVKKARKNIIKQRVQEAREAEAAVVQCDYLGRPIKRPPPKINKRLLPGLVQAVHVNTTILRKVEKTMEAMEKLFEKIKAERAGAADKENEEMPTAEDEYTNESTNETTDDLEEKSPTDKSATEEEDDVEAGKNENTNVQEEATSTQPDDVEFNGQEETVAGLPMVDYVVNELKGMVDGMTQMDWDTALERTRQRSTEFPLFERRSVKIYNLLDDDAQTHLMLEVTEMMNQYFMRHDMMAEITDYTRHRVMTFLVAKLVELGRVGVDSTPEEDDARYGRHISDLATSLVEQGEDDTNATKPEAAVEGSDATQVFPPKNFYSAQKTAPPKRKVESEDEDEDEKNFDEAENQPPKRPTRVRGRNAGGKAKGKGRGKNRK